MRRRVISASMPSRLALKPALPVATVFSMMAMDSILSVIPRCAMAHRGCATWRRPGIHTPDRGYGFRARATARPGMTDASSRKLLALLAAALLTLALGLPSLADEPDAPKGAAVTVLRAVKSCFSSIVEATGIIIA